MALQWHSTPLPQPVANTQVTWSVTGFTGDGSDVVFSSSDTSVVTTGPTTITGTYAIANVFVQGLGASVITATQGSDSITRYCYVGQLLVYSPDGQLWAAQSNDWSPAEIPSGSEIPTLEQMQDSGAGLSWVPPGTLPDNSSETFDGTDNNVIAVVTCYVMNMDNIDNVAELPQSSVVYLAVSNESENS